MTTLTRLPDSSTIEFDTKTLESTLTDESGVKYRWVSSGSHTEWCHGPHSIDDGEWVEVEGQ